MVLRIRSAAFLAGCFALLGNSLQAQTQQDPARAAAATSNQGIGLPSSETPEGLDEENVFAERSPGDSDIGQQLLLKSGGKNQPFKFWLDSSLYWTDNAANQDINKAQDYFYAFGANLGWQQQIRGRYYADGFLGQHWFRYDSMRQLNYENGEASLGLLAVLPELGNSVFHLHYYYQRLTQELTGTPVYEAHNLRVGLQKTFLINRLHSVSAGFVSTFGVAASPSLLQRHEHVLQFGHNLKLSSKWVLSSSYRLAYFDYFNFGGREDWYQIMGSSLNYKVNKNFQLSAAYYFSINDSSGAFDYQSQLGGLNVAAKIQF